MKTRASRGVRWAAVFGAFAAMAAAPSAAEAAGLFVADRGVRPLARGGAFVAGADDLGALMYNPAGLFDAGGQFLLDAAWVNYASEYSRQALVKQMDPNTGQTTAEFSRPFPTVEGTTPFLPIPTVAASYPINKKMVVAGGVWAPYAGLTTYPETVDGPNGTEPAPQRYSLITLDGSVLAYVGAGIGYAPTEKLRLGATVSMLTGVFSSTVVFSGCVPERFFCAPESPDWDVLAELSGGPIFAPTGQVGAIFIPNSMVRVGASFQLPTWVRTAATIKTRMPAAPVFEKAKQEGEAADLAFELPWNVNVGVEGRFIDNLRIEAGFKYEGWSMHDAIRVEPDHIALKNVVGFPESYYIPPVSLTRGFKDSFSVRVGGEYELNLLGKRWSTLAGFTYESSAIPDEYLSVLTLDAGKVTTALGVALHVGSFRFDLTYAHVFASEVTVDPRVARVAQVSPVKANPSQNPDYINGGIYNQRTNVIGLGATYTFGATSATDAPAATVAPVAAR